MDYRELGFHARGVYLTQDASCMGTATLKQEEKADNSNSKRVVRNLEQRNAGTKGKSPKQSLISAKDLTIELSEGLNYPKA